MYSPPILFSVQDDINNRRATRNKYKTSVQAELLETITTTRMQKHQRYLASMDKKTRQEYEEQEKKRQGKKSPQKTNQIEELSLETGETEVVESLVVDRNLGHNYMQKRVNLAVAGGPTQVVRLMHANPTNHQLLSSCIGRLSDMASFSQRDEIGVHKGMFASRNHTDYDRPTDHILQEIGKAKGIKAILDAMMKHQAKEGLVLRGLWALEHVLLLRDNWLLFNRQGGQARLAALNDVHAKNKSPAGKKIRRISKKLRFQPRSGDTISLSSKFCNIL